MEESVEGIRVKFVSNLDGFNRHQWPDKVTCKPEKGDLVESVGGKLLRVASVIHTTTNDPEYVPRVGRMRRMMPCLKVELTVMEGHTIRDNPL